MIFYYIIGSYVIMNLVLSITWMKAQDSTLWGIDDIKKKGDLPKFTIIVPVRNEAKNILELLESLEKQTYPKLYFEVIIANDSSNDNTVEIIENFKKNNCINLVYFGSFRRQWTPRGQNDCLSYTGHSIYNK